LLEIGDSYGGIRTKICLIYTSGKMPLRLFLSKIRLLSLTAFFTLERVPDRELFAKLRKYNEGVQMESGSTPGC
jgi:hypothetical protein